MAAIGLASVALAQKVRELKPADSVAKIPIEQDIQIGRQAAKEVPQQMAVVQNQRAQAFVDRVTSRLTSQPEAGEYPYSMGIVYDPSINAFAFPGGTMFVHTGLITAADNEDQVAGVLAHEVAHVALRHGVANMVRAQKMQVGAGIAGALAGIFLGGAAGQLSQMAIGFGAQSLLLKNSRDAETEADLLGTRMMNRAGYNPIEMARFFEKLEAEVQAAGGGQSEFFSNHPSPGNRVRNVEQEIQTLPRATYDAARPQDFQQARAAIAGMKAPPRTAKPGQGGGRGNRPDPGAQPPSPVPGNEGPAGEVRRGTNGMQQYRGRVFAIDFPEGWEVFPGQDADSITLAPQGGITAQGQVRAGVVISGAPRKGDLRYSTEKLFQGLRQQNPQIRLIDSRTVSVYGAPGLLLTAQNGSELDYIVTSELPDRLFYAVFVTPSRNRRQAEPIFSQMVQSIRFAQ
jgi:Zn-dependent protease with chaperone function